MLVAKELSGRNSGPSKRIFYHARRTARCPLARLGLITSDQAEILSTIANLVAESDILPALETKRQLEQHYHISTESETRSMGALTLAVIEHYTCRLQQKEQRADLVPQEAAYANRQQLFQELHLGFTARLLLNSESRQPAL